ncbi:Munc13 homology 1 [Arabidopsis thaliana x Arabidopsis arenosa]|uniref:Uncharacterized protein n=3 Tax=Arabidopsis TaxID=3701 RepID=A0A178VVV6_ARATH|nr:Munc13 homology 1 [Arabidopsis thaliana x Arabidopsis arenosa]KAG7641377.1 Munc13 homology 1 [Arabidopsis suecica]OAP09183.1 hypothetical protein AXX17_AT2G15340 [Arabidopsis thaliana]
MESLPSPFGDPAPNLSNSELRETAYEILVAACRSTGSRPLTYIPQSPKSDRSNGLTTASLSPSPSLHRSLTSTAASKVKKALGMKKRIGDGDGGAGESSSQPDRSKKSVTVGELVRVQMRISEQIDSRIRRALLRIASGQLGRRVEMMVLPLELLQQLKASDFPDQEEYESWQRRNLKLLEAGLILYPCVPLSKSDKSVQQLKQIIRSSLERPLDTGKITGETQNLRSLVMSLASRQNNNGIGSETCHWADGFPLNLRIYQMLLESCFDVNDELLIVEEVDEVLELIKKTWPVLGINQMIHNVCFLWVLFNRYVSTGQVENDLLVAAHNLILEIENDAMETNDPEYSKILSSVLSLVMDWGEKRLLAYHDTFNIDNVETLETTVSLGILVAKVLGEDISSEYRRKKKHVDSGRDRVDTYIRSSLRMAFQQTKRMVEHSKKSKSRQSTNNLPALAILAEDIGHLAFNEKAIFSPILKNWHPLAAGVAAATLHSCYGTELKKFVSGITELTPDAIRVLTAADKLEKDLVQIAVQDAVDSEDGGKSVIREMPPFEAEVVIGNLVKSWIKIRVDRLKEWIDRNLQQEVWNPRSNKLGIAPSAVDVLRMVDETLEAFFLLPILLHPVLLPELTSGLDKCMQHYVSKAKSSCGSRNTFLPALPALTRCTVGSRLHGVFKKKEKPMVASHRRKSQLGTGNDSAEILQFCCRINTLQYIRTEIESSGRKTLNRLPESEVAALDAKGKIFEQSIGYCSKGIQQLSEATAYKIVFHDLSNVLWDGLYLGEVPSSRIEPFLQELERCLEIISSSVHDRVRTRVISDIMRASFDGFLLVLLAGGPSRGFTIQDSAAVEEDFKFLCDLFWSNGDGLPLDLIEKVSTTVKSILPLLRTDTDSLIERFKAVCLENHGSDRGKLPLPPTSGPWSPTEPNTLLRVLCYRYDEPATKFLKKTYNLPRKLT